MQRVWKYPWSLPAFSIYEEVSWMRWASPTAIFWCCSNLYIQKPMKLCVPTPTLQCANAISCNCWETGSVCYLPRLKVMIQHPPSVFIKALFKLIPGWQSKKLHSTPLGKLVAATLKLRINSCGGAGSQRETQSDPSETNNSSFPGRLCCCSCCSCCLESCTAQLTPPRRLPARP